MHFFFLLQKGFIFYLSLVFTYRYLCLVETFVFNNQLKQNKSEMQLKNSTNKTGVYLCRVFLYLSLSLSVGIRRLLQQALWLTHTHTHTSVGFQRRFWVSFVIKNALTHSLNLIDNCPLFYVYFFLSVRFISANSSFCIYVFPP